ncbi:hypothetical protein JI435_413840 [Parastagonospora nodorum SN15]|uniref:Uncharacterized protein n=1 Tax=Phaeosphaeria nodorum (strain SN15 / ATCC MYA-4574 / FGSC 10173) TaxID=321614 RepID=A0A7U2F8T8_PHANO|nr:hypothetical protein JI435_413840 [Parastagonospora nodorum SN15]
MEETYNHDNGDAAEEGYLRFPKTSTLLERETTIIKTTIQEVPKGP